MSKAQTSSHDSTLQRLREQENIVKNLKHFKEKSASEQILRKKVDEEFVELSQELKVVKKMMVQKNVQNSKKECSKTQSKSRIPRLVSNVRYKVPSNPSKIFERTAKMIETLNEDQLTLQKTGRVNYLDIKLSECRQLFGEHLKSLNELYTTEKPLVDTVKLLDELIVRKLAKF